MRIANSHPPAAKIRATSLVVFGLGTFLFWSSLYVYVPVLSVYARTLGAPLTLVGLVVGIYGATQMIIRIPIGLASDLIGRRRPFILAGLVASGLGCLGLAWSPNPWFLVGSRAMLGLGAATWVAFSVLFASYYPLHRSAQAMSLISFVNGAAQALAGLAGGYLSEQWGPGSTFYAGAFLALVGFAVMLAVPESAQPKPTGGMSLSRLLAIARTPALLLASGVALLSYLAMFTTTFTFVPIYARNLGASDADLGVLQTATLVAYTLGMLVGASAGERVGERWVILIGMSFAGLATALTPLALGLVPLALSQMAASVGRGLCIPILMSLAIRPLPARERASGMGVFQAIYSVGMFVGPPLGGAVADRLGLSVVFVLVGALCILAGAWGGISSALSGRAVGLSEPNPALEPTGGDHLGQPG